MTANHPLVAEPVGQNRRAMSTTTRRRDHVTVAAASDHNGQHPLKSRCNSPFVPDQIMTTPTKQQQQQQQQNRRNNIGEESTSSCHSSLTTTINTASLIQSAARSVLDSVYTPTSTNNVSDDENDDGNDDNDNTNCDERRQQHHHHHRQTTNKNNNNDNSLPTLQSLEREKLPAMPDEQDRKRFVGCFAAILASTYDYDVAHDVEDTQAHRAESYAYLNRNEQGHYDDSDDDDDAEYSGGGGGGEYEGAAHEYYGAATAATATGSNGEVVDDGDFGEELQQLEDDFLSQSISTSFEYADYSDNMGMAAGGSQQPAQKQQQQQQQRQQQRQQQPVPIKAILKKCTLARNRHRKRRYDLLSRLLLSSAELLLLDKCQARAFLPMLARLLVPPTASEKFNSDRIRQRKQQLQRRQQYQERQQQEQDQRQQQNNDSQSQSRTSTPTKLSSSSSSTNNSPATTPDRQIRSPNTSTSTSTVQDTNAKLDNGVNHYHFSPTTSIPQSRRVPLPSEQAADNNNAAYGSNDNDNNDNSFVANDLDDEEHLRPFLESLNPGAGFRCLSLFLLQHLLNSAEGYDARTRHVIKKLGVTVLVHDMERERDLELIEVSQQGQGIAEDDTRSHRSGSSKSSKRSRRRSKRGLTREDLVEPATRKFEALEHSIAVRLIRLSKEQQRTQKQQQQGNTGKGRKQQRNRRPAPASNAPPVLAAPTFSREQILRGLKIGSAGLVAGTIFAVTGGLAAPGIAAGVAAIAGSTAATAAVAAIVSSTTAVTAIFGVGGGSLAAYKMNRRTQGLTDFEFRRQDKLPAGKTCTPEEDEEAQAELFSTVCISGWLRDENDFQRPWGIAPTNPRIRDRLELLERFYSVYRPDHVSKCQKILASWKGEERQLWELLKQKYGRDPDSLYPIVLAHENGFHRGLTLEQDEVLNELFVELGYVQKQSDISHTPKSEASMRQSPASAFENVRERLAHPFFGSNDNSRPTPQKNTGHSSTYFQDSSSNLAAPYRNVSALLDDSMLGPGGVDGLSCASSAFDSLASSQIPSGVSQHSNGGEEGEEYLPPKHLATVWDYHSKYGGELYTVKWESEMLVELCDSVADLAFDVINGATAQILRQTALHTLISAVAVPYALINAANMIDGPWTLAVERADEAGKELAKSLLFSRAGHRPVTLVGFSFGARAIYSCLKELAKYQQKWEASRENSKTNEAGICYEGDPNQTSEGYSWTLREPASIVEDVILMGLPNHLSLTSWKACRQVVGGRLVNCYSRKDLILSLMFQIKRLAGVLRPVCGTCVVNVPGVENVDVSDLISGHQEYCLVTGEILKRVRHGQPFRTKATSMNDGIAQNAHNVALIGM